MSYDVKDRSVASGEPVECYEFVTAHKTWRFTSYHSAITMAGEVYEPLPITRSTIETGSIIDTLQTMDFNVPSDHEIAQTFCYTLSPRNLDVTVRRGHIGDDLSVDFKVEYVGEILGASPAGNWGIIRTGNKLQSKLNGNLSSVIYQKLCNHKLFDERCKVVKADFTESAVVTKVQGQIITVDDMVFAADELIGGEMVNTRTGESQGIISNDFNILRIGFTFFDIVVGDTVELTRGCNHVRLGDCKTVFDNVVNYGGFDHIPEVNPFANLLYTSRTSTKETTNKAKEEELRPPRIWRAVNSTAG